MLTDSRVPGLKVGASGVSMVLTSALLVQERSAGIRRTSTFVWTNVSGWPVMGTEEDSADALATWGSSRNGFLA